MSKKRLSQLQTHLHNGMLLNGVISEVGEKAFAIYVIISLFADWHTGHSCVAYSTLMRLTGITDHHTLKHHIGILEDSGHLTLEYRKMVVNGKEQGRKRYFYTLASSAEDTYFRPH